MTTFNIKIPNLLEPNEDELIYSYACRLCRENGLNTLNTFIARLLQNETNCFKVAHTPYYYDGTGIFAPLFTALDTVKQAQLIKDCSMYPFQSMFLTPGQQKITISRLFNTKTTCTENIRITKFIQKYKYCKKCMEEDIKNYGYYYLHRIHQLPNVKVCCKHNIPLFTENNKQEQLNQNENENEYYYAKFSRDLLYSGIQTNIGALIKVILKYQEEINYKTPMLIPESELNLNANTTNIHSFIKQLIKTMMNTFITVDKLKTLLPNNNETINDFINTINTEYEVLGPYNSTIIKIRHKTCGATTYTIPERLPSPPICQSCDKNQQNANINFQKKVKDLVGDEYTVIGKYTTEKTPIKILHNKCGHSKTYKPYDFLNGNRCGICTPSIKEKNANIIINILTHNQYRITKKLTNDYYEFTEENGTTIITTIKKFLQECIRPTPSDLLPVPIKNLNTNILSVLYNNKTKVSFKMNPELKYEIINHIYTNYTNNDLIFREDLYKSFENKLTKNQFAHIINNIKNKIIFPVAYGIYLTEPRTVTTDEIIKQKYLYRKGKQIGIYNNHSLAYEMNIIENKPSRLYILINPKQINLITKKTYYTSFNIKVKKNIITFGHSTITITNQNYKYIMVLQALRYCYHNNIKKIPSIIPFIINNNLKFQDFIPLLPHYSQQIQRLFNELKEKAWPKSLTKEK